MCGLVGACLLPGCPERRHQAETAAALLRASVHRGRDATGWCYPGRDGTVVRKLPEPATSPHVRVDVPRDAPWWQGHVRWATHGDPGLSYNNHPIRHGRVVGCHNGVLDAVHAEQLLVLCGGRQDRRALVDSEAVFAALDRWGPEDGLPRLRGTWAATWTAEADPTAVHLARGPGRPLWLAETAAGVYWASEPLTLGVGLPRRTELLDLLELRPGDWVTLRGGEIADMRRLKLREREERGHAAVRVRHPAARRQAAQPVDGGGRVPRVPGGAGDAPVRDRLRVVPGLPA